MADEKTSASSSEAQTQDDKVDLTKSSEAATGTAGESTAEPVGKKAEQRIRQLVSERDEIKSVAEWYRENVGTPEDVIEFRKWKTEQVKVAEKAQAAGQISPQQLQEVRQLMRQADPEYAAMLQHVQQQIQDRADAMLISAEEEVRELCAGIGFKGEADEDKINMIARQVSLAIRDDETLFKMWRAGDIRCVKKAFNDVNEKFLKPLRGSTTPAQSTSQKVQQKRKVASIPSLPAGSPSVSQPQSQQREKGITKQTHADAWDLLQSMRQQ